ncbi:MAG: hypothetical protein ACFFD8_10940, partial [Candidatus Thorarchaeota archaeon]
DVCLGGTLLSLALIIWILPEFWYFTIGGLIAWMFVYTSAKRYITTPRLGYAEFSKIRRHRTQSIFLAAMVILVIFNVLAIMAWIYPQLGILIFESPFTILIFGFLGLFFFSFIGFVSNIWRFYIYGAILLGSTFITFMLPVTPLLPFIVTGIVIMTFGVFLVYRFMRRYPKQPTGEVTGA